jgi:hypothetical protein
MNLNKKNNLESKRVQSVEKIGRLNPIYPEASTFDYFIYNENQLAQSKDLSFWVVIFRTEEEDEIFGKRQYEGIGGMYMMFKNAKKSYEGRMNQAAEEARLIDEERKKRLAQKEEKPKGNDSFYRTKDRNLLPDSGGVKKNDGSTITINFISGYNYKDYTAEPPENYDTVVSLELREIPFFPEPKTVYIFNDGAYPFNWEPS